MILGDQRLNVTQQVKRFYCLTVGILGDQRLNVTQQVKRFYCLTVVILGTSGWMSHNCIYSSIIPQKLLLFSISSKRISMQICAHVRWADFQIETYVWGRFMQTGPSNIQSGLVAHDLWRTRTRDGVRTAWAYNLCANGSWWPTALWPTSS